MFIALMNGSVKLHLDLEAQNVNSLSYSYIYLLNNKVI